MQLSVHVLVLDLPLFKKLLKSCKFQPYKNKLNIMINMYTQCYGKMTGHGKFSDGILYMLSKVKA